LARKILLADDSVTAQNMGRRILSDAGYEVITVNNGAAALKKISEVRPDLIVLDVYMPGYGGLEVCQRIKESPDTARIPVLLTVGKMEPFKADEARRVRADGHIIKPFEASELLTALTKLEDKIVPIADPQKGGRSGKASAATQKIETGDSEWKNRLRIPPPSAKPLEPEKSTKSAAKKGSSEPHAVPETEVRDRDSKRKKDFDEVAPRKSAASTTQEETPEEIPARLADRDNGAANDGQSVGSTARTSESEIPDEVSTTQSASSSAEWLEAQKAKEAATAVETGGTKEDKFASEEPETEAVTFASAPLDSSSISSVSSYVTEKSDADLGQSPDKHAGSETDFMAALASLVPATGNGHSATKSEVGDAGSAVSAENSDLVVTQISGPRWIAHSVALTADESKLFLEQEMEKSNAAHAAGGGVENLSTANVDGNGAAASEVISAMTTAEAVSAEQPETTSGNQANVPDTEVAAKESIASANSNSDGGEIPSGAAIPAVISSETVAVAIDDSATNVAVPVEEAVFAAAASAGAVAAESTSLVNGVSHSGLMAASTDAEVTSTMSSVEPHQNQADRQRETELAAAWQNWKQIRETIVGPQAEPQSASSPASQMSDSAAAISGDPVAASGFKDLRESKAAAQPIIESGEPEADESAIASIVDNMLADLKPKLMEEIARKMAKEKK
jgi:CheY-like chemotaxis protein